MPNSLIFVYNASSGLFSQLTDFVHKKFSPQTYKCNLCKLTYQNFRMDREWQKFLKKLPYELEFLHKDQIAIAYPGIKDIQPPAVFLKSKNLELLISSTELNKLKTLPELESLLLIKIKKLSIKK